MNLLVELFANICCKKKNDVNWTNYNDVLNHNGITYLLQFMLIFKNNKNQKDYRVLEFLSDHDIRKHMANE